MRIKFEVLLILKVKNQEAELDMGNVGSPAIAV